MFVLKKKKKILIVKCSSLGDILQAFVVIEYLSDRLPHATIDWLVEKNYEELVRSHPKIDEIIGITLKGAAAHLLSFFRQIILLRKKKYDWIFDLQGNSKSSFFTLLARGGKKIGFGKKTVREWPNIFATHIRFDPDPRKNMRQQYLEIVQKFLQDPHPYRLHGHLLTVTRPEERKYCEALLQQEDSFRVMVAPSSRWENKKLSHGFWRSFLEKIALEKDPFFYFIWGSEKEKREVAELSALFSKSMVVEKLSLPAVQTVMSKMDLLLAVDSCMLHLAATLPHIATFSLFGPTQSEVFNPEGKQHAAFQGKCVFGHTFLKSCSHLRTCSTGSCLKRVSFAEIEPVWNSFKGIINEKQR